MQVNEPLSTQSDCHLFSIAPELRNLIYEYALVSEEFIDVDCFSKSRRCRLTALLETCQAIRQEASPIFYELNTFRAIIRLQSEGIPQQRSTLPTFHAAKTARIGRLAILLVYDNGSKAYSRDATFAYLRRVCNAFVRRQRLRLLILSSPDGHSEDTALRKRDESRQPIDSAEEDEVRLAGLVGLAIRDQPPKDMVDWSRKLLDEWLSWELEDALSNAEEDGDWDAVVEESRLRASCFRDQIAMLSEIPGQATLGVAPIRWMNSETGSILGKGEECKKMDDN
ncbi:hypothetical protein LTR53_016687 [Teratosphaeriaceae sp. CCFEE 6253]|nr:hypothetical protein LTR53_016687 [Teratosphaeriaceae sp. CCFEE 6253]